MLAWWGARCWITTNAKPLSTGTREKNFSKASRPPADAPIPTMGTTPPTDGGPFSCLPLDSGAGGEVFSPRNFFSAGSAGGPALLVAFFGRTRVLVLAITARIYQLNCATKFSNLAGC